MQLCRGGEPVGTGLVDFNVIKISYFYKDMLLLICRIFYKFI